MTWPGGTPAGSDLSGWGDGAPAGYARPILQSATDGFCLANTAGRILQVNPALVQMCGWSPEELQQRQLADIVGAGGSAEIAAWIQQVVTRGADRIETMHRHNDGAAFEVEMSGVFVPDAGGRVSIFIRDIRERKRLEREASIRTLRDAALLELEAVGDHDDEQAFMQRAQESAEDLTGSGVSFILFVHRDQSTVELVNWSRRTMAACPGYPSRRHLTVERAGLWAEAIRQKRPVILNDYPGAPGKRGLPAEHLPLLRMISVPVLEHGRVALLMAVGNKAAPYDEADVRTVELFAGAVWRIIQRRRWQHELQQSHQLLTKLTDHVPGVVYQYQLFPDGSSCFPFASRGMSDIYEVTPEEVRKDATPVFGRLHPEDAADVSARILQSAETLGIFGAEFRVVLPRQGLRWRQSYATPERLPDGSILWHGIILDVTARMTAEIARRETEKRFRTLFEGAADAVFLHDQSGRIVDVNRTACSSLGYSQEELVGMNVADIETTAAAKPQPTFAAEAPMTVKGRHRRKNGTTFPVEVHVAPFESREGPLLFAAVRDVTQREVAERMLRLQGGALEATANAVVIIGIDGRIEWANAAFTQLSGWALAECMGRDLRSLISSGEQDPVLVDQMWATIRAGQVWRGELVNRRRDGTLWTEDLTITPLLDEHGVISHFVAVKQDITEKKKMERRLLQGQRMEAMGKLAGGIAHDLNNILAPMLMVVPLVRERVPDAPTRDLLDMVLHEARRGGDIIKQLLAFTRGLEGPRTPVEPAAAIGELEKVLRETFPRNISVHTRCEPALWRVLADPTQMHQVLLNLCINARDAMPDGGGLILTATNVQLAAGHRRLPAGASPGNYVMLEVTDTGTGIPAAIKEVIFEPFFTTKAIGQGSGLGLSTVLGIVRSHLGFVQVDSEVGCGSTFRVFLPALPDAATPLAGPPAEGDRAKGHGELILVVDDEPMLRISVTVALERSGYQVCVAESGEAALRLFGERGRQIGLVLTDIMMPGIGGTALIRRLRELAPGLPVIATSGLADRDRTAELSALGVTEVLPKPCTLERLLAAVQRQLLASVAAS